MSNDIIDSRLLFILDDEGNVVPANMKEWAAWRSSHNHKIRRDYADGCLISTVFIGINLSVGSGVEPLVFETMVFNEEDFLVDKYSERYATIKEALAGHERVVAMVKRGDIR